MTTTCYAGAADGDRRLMIGRYTAEVPCNSAGLAVVPVARHSACAFAWHSWEQPVVAVCRVAPVDAAVPVFPSIVRISAL